MQSLLGPLLVKWAWSKAAWENSGLSLRRAVFSGKLFELTGLTKKWFVM